MAGIIAILLYGIKWAKQKPPTDVKNMKNETGSKGKGKGNVDRVFWKRVMILIKKVIPGWSSIEARYIVILSVLLVVRTMLSIWLADVNGKVVKAIVEMSWTNFVQRIFQLFLFAVPSSTVNAGIDYLNLKLALRFRKRLT